MKASDLNLDDLLDHTSTPKKHPGQKKTRKPKASEVLKPYIPKPMAPDPTPDAVILYWRKTECTCGATFEGPRYFPNSTFYRVKLPTRAGNMEKWDFIPKFLPDQYHDIPHLTETEYREVTNCSVCHGKNGCPPHQEHFQFEDDKDVGHYTHLLTHKHKPIPFSASIATEDSDRVFKEDIQEILKGGATLGREIALLLINHIDKRNQIS